MPVADFFQGNIVRMDMAAGIERVAPGKGAEISVEIWALAPAAFASFVAAIPPPLGIGTLAFADGTSAKGFLAEAVGVEGAEDVSRFGGWRAFVGR